MSSPRLRDRPAWRVRIEQHRLSAGRSSWVIPETVVTRFEGNAATAVKMAVLEAHVRAGVLPFRSLTRESVRHAAAVKVMATAAGGGE